MNTKLVFMTASEIEQWRTWVQDRIEKHEKELKVQYQDISTNTSLTNDIRSDLDALRDKIEDHAASLEALTKMHIHWNGRLSHLDEKGEPIELTPPPDVLAAIADWMRDFNANPHKRYVCRYCKTELRGGNYCPKHGQLSEMSGEILELPALLHASIVDSEGAGNIADTRPSGPYCVKCGTGMFPLYTEDAHRCPCCKWELSRLDAVRIGGLE